MIVTVAIKPITVIIFIMMVIYQYQSLNINDTFQIMMNYVYAGQD